MIRVTPTPLVRLPLQAIPGGDRTLYGSRRSFGCVSDSVFDQSTTTIFKMVRNRVPCFYLIGTANQITDEW